MGLYASWNHGNALTVENPENLTQVGHFGWGTEMLIAPSKKSWFHITLPTPVLVKGVQSKLVRCFLLFRTVSGSIRNVHIYDGRRLVQEFNNLNLTGTHYDGVDTTNTPNWRTHLLFFWELGYPFYSRQTLSPADPLAAWSHLN